MEPIELKKRDVFFLRALETDELLILIFTVTLFVLLVSVYLWDRNQKNIQSYAIIPLLAIFAISLSTSVYIFGNTFLRMIDRNYPSIGQIAPGFIGLLKMRIPLSVLGPHAPYTA